MRTIFVIFLTFSFFLLALKSRLAGLYTYWWIAIFRPHDWIFDPILTNIRISLISLVLLVIPSFLQGKIPRISHPIAFLMVLLLILLLIADFLNGCETAFIVRTTTVLDLSILFFVILLTTELTTDHKKLYWLITIIGLSIAAHSAKGGMIALATGQNYYGREHLTGLFADSNAYALGSGMLIFFMLFAFQQIKSGLVFEQINKWYNRPFVLKMFKLLLALLILGTLYNIVALSSRGSFLATILGLYLWMNLQPKMIRNNIIGILIVSLGVSFVPVPDGYEERIKSAFVGTENLDKSAASRPHFWGTAEDIVADHPFGVGPGCFPAFYDQYDTSEGFFGTRRSVHSSHYQVLNDSGYMGFIVWVLLFLISYWKILKIRRLSKENIKDQAICKYYTDISNMFFCCQTVFLVGGSFYEYAYNDIIWLVLGLVMSVERNFKKELKLKENKVSKKLAEIDKSV